MADSNTRPDTNIAIASDTINHDISNNLLNFQTRNDNLSNIRTLTNNRPIQQFLMQIFAILFTMFSLCALLKSVYEGQDCAINRGDPMALPMLSNQTNLTLL